MKNTCRPKLREWDRRYAQEMRELEELVGKATTEKEELVKECEYLQSAFETGEM